MPAAAFSEARRRAAPGPSSALDMDLFYKTLPRVVLRMQFGAALVSEAQRGVDPDRLELPFEALPVGRPIVVALAKGFQAAILQRRMLDLDTTPSPAETSSGGLPASTSIGRRSKTRPKRRVFNVGPGRAPDGPRTGQGGQSTSMARALMQAGSLFLAVRRESVGDGLDPSPDPKEASARAGSSAEVSRGRVRYRWGRPEVRGHSRGPRVLAHSGMEESRR